MSVNKAILVGNLGADPEMRQTNSGQAVCNLRIATTHRTKNGDNWEPATEWHNVVCFGRTAENVGQYCTKGKQVYIEGRIQTRKWTDSDGNERKSTEVVAHEVKFLGSRQADQPSHQEARHQSAAPGYGGRDPANDRGRPQPSTRQPFDEGIPF